MALAEEGRPALRLQPVPLQRAAPCPCGSARAHANLSRNEWQPGRQPAAWSALCSSGAHHGAPSIAPSQNQSEARGHAQRAREGRSPRCQGSQTRGRRAPISAATRAEIWPPRRRRLPVRPPRRFALARQPSTNSEARALWRHSPSAQSFSVASCRSNPMATRRHSFAIGRRSQYRVCSRRRALACAHGGARLPSRLAVGRSLFFGGGRTWVH